MTIFKELRHLPVPDNHSQGVGGQTSLLFFSLRLSIPW